MNAETAREVLSEGTRQGCQAWESVVVETFPDHRDEDAGQAMRAVSAGVLSAVAEETITTFWRMRWELIKM